MSYSGYNLQIDLDIISKNTTARGTDWKSTPPILNKKR